MPEPLWIRESVDPFAAARARLRQRLATAPPTAEVALDDIVAEITDLRPLPQVALKILALDDGAFSAHELASIVAGDQALTAKLLRLSNSAYYGFARRITSVRDAVVLLGFRAVRSATLASCVMQGMPPSPNLDYESFWQFSVATGMLAEVLARTEGVHQDDAFTAGILHQIGVLALDQVRSEALREAIERAATGEVTLHEAEREHLGCTDVELGGALALHWSFPPTLVEAVRDHARPLSTLPDARSLTAFVLRARMFVRAYGLSDGISPRTEPTSPPQEWEMPPLSIALRQSGGMAKVMERADAFLAASLG